MLLRNFRSYVVATNFPESDVINFDDIGAPYIHLIIVVMTTLGLQSPTSPLQLCRTSAIGRSRRGGSDAITALRACLACLDRLSAGDFFGHVADSDAVRRTVSTIADDRRALINRRRQTPKQQAPADRIKRSDQELPNHSIRNKDGSLLSLRPSMATVGDSGYSSDSSDKELKEEEGDDCIPGGGEVTGDVSCQMPKRVTFADEKGQQLVTVWPLDGRAFETNCDNISGRQKAVSPSPNAGVVVGVDDQLKPRRKNCGLTSQTLQPMFHTQHWQHQRLTPSTSVRLVSNCNDIIIRLHPGAGTDESYGAAAGGSVALRSRRQVALESISVDVNHGLLNGSILVRAPPPQTDGAVSGDLTTVFVRTTTNNWKTQADLPASYRCRLHVAESHGDGHSGDSFVDVYVFEIPLKRFKHRRCKLTPSLDARGDRVNHQSELSTEIVEFAVAAISQDERSQIWDNNNGSNYRLQCTMTQ